MKTLTSSAIKVNGTESKVFIVDGALLVSTKMGDMKVNGTNSANKTLSFNANGKSVCGVKFEGCFETVNALFNSVNTDKARELVVFESYEEFLSVRDNSFGSDFTINGVTSAYKYI